MTRTRAEGTTIEGSRVERGRAAPARVQLALAIIAYPDDPARTGETAPVTPGRARFLGRGGPPSDDDGWLSLVRARPGLSAATPPLAAPGLSRKQLEVESDGQRLRVRNAGRGALLWNGRPVAECSLEPGDVVEVEGQLGLLCVRRPVVLPRLRSFPADHAGTFGCSDRVGLVGESAAAWALRDRLAFIARRAGHVLVLGESGSGKEVAARAIHALSSRAGRALVSRSAAALPEGLIDAELFGNVASYPNPGLRARPGLVGEADGSTLFLDEIGQLPEAQQGHLLRVLDQGEYTRLGEALPQRSDFRLVAATNRDPSALKHDFLARLVHRLTLPSLAERPEDVALLARHLVREVAGKDADVGAAFCDPRGEPRLSIELLRALTLHRYTHQVRELARLLWLSLSSSEGDTLELTPEVTAELHPARAAPEPGEPTREALEDALSRHHGKRAAVVRELGLKDRFVLYRLLRKHGLALPEA